MQTPLDLTVVLTYYFIFLSSLVYINNVYLLYIRRLSFFLVYFGLFWLAPVLLIKIKAVKIFWFSFFYVGDLLYLCNRK